MIADGKIWREVQPHYSSTSCVHELAFCSSYCTHASLLHTFPLVIEKLLAFTRHLGLIICVVSRYPAISFRFMAIGGRPFTQYRIFMGSFSRDRCGCGKHGFRQADNSEQQLQKSQNLI
jgi:hypothetical protein